jgi:hypothetical protein
MVEKDYELLSQFLDGELPAAEAQALRERLIADPRLRATLEEMRAVDQRVRNAFDIPGVDTVPETVTARLQGAHTNRPASGPYRRARGLAVAAALVAAAGLLLAPQWRDSSGGHSTGTPSADDLLAQVLEHAPSRAEGWEGLTDGRQVRPVLSFASKEGTWCREFLLTETGATFRGVACRSGGSWRTEVLSDALRPGVGSVYRPAGAAGAAVVESYINAHADSIPLGVEEEADLINRNWQ